MHSRIEWIKRCAGGHGAAVAALPLGQAQACVCPAAAWRGAQVCDFPCISLLLKCVAFCVSLLHISSLLYISPSHRLTSASGSHSRAFISFAARGRQSTQSAYTFKYHKQSVGDDPLS